MKELTPEKLERLKSRLHCWLMNDQDFKYDDAVGFVERAMSYYKDKKNEESKTVALRQCPKCRSLGTTDSLYDSCICQCCGHFYKPSDH